MKVRLKTAIMATVLLIAQFSLTACSSGPDKPLDLDYFKNEVAGKTWITSMGSEDLRTVWEPTNKPNVYKRVSYIGDLKVKAAKQELYRIEIYDKAKHDPNNRKADHDYDFESIHVKRGYHREIIIEGDELHEYSNGDILEHELEEE